MNVDSAYDLNPLIRTPDQKLRVFVSSTLKELAGERAAARRAIEHLHLAPVMFELGARPHQARDLYRAYLQQSHIFLGIYGEKYGWVAPHGEISGLEEEYRIAEGKTKLIYIKRPVEKRDRKLTALLGRIRDVDGISYKYFTNKEELEELIISDLALLQAEVFETVHSQDTTNDNSVRHHAIPAPVTSLLGRHDDVKRAKALLQSPEVRLITFTGPGGSGKTRLAIEVARALVNHFPQPCFVALASIQNPDLVADAIAHALGIKEAGEKHAGQLIQEYLHPRRMLLILDNFEQLADAAAPMIAELLGSCPQLKIIVTSRMSLQIRGEREFPVGPLALPDINKKLTARQLSDYAAVALFCQRARDIKPGFSIHGKNAGEISRICNHLDGLPLAIELAAARIRVLSPGAMLKRLESNLPLLTGGVKDLPERQRTMRQTIAWSYQLLHQHEAVLFRNMAVFSGGATLETIAAVCDQEELEGVDIFDLLENLLRKNMVIQLEPDVGEVRYGMLETIRDYALGQLEDSREQSRVFTRHAKYFTQLAEQAEPFLTSAQRDEWLTRIEDEMDNFRAVFNHSLSASIDPRYGIRIAGTLGWFWHLRGYLTEGRNWSASLMQLTQAAGRNRLRAKLLFPAGGLAWSQGDYETANRYLGEAAEIFNQTGDLLGLTDATAILAGGLASLGKLDQAQALCEDTACRLRKSGDRWGLAFILFWLGSIILAQHRQTEKAISLFKEIHSIALELNDAWLHAEALNHLGMAMGMKGNFNIANACFEDSMKLHESIGDHWGIAFSLTGFGEVTLMQGDLHASYDLFRKATHIWKKMGNRLGLLTCLTGFAQIAAADNDLKRAACLYGACSEPHRTIGYLFLQIPKDECDQLFSRARQSMDPDTWGKECEAGNNMTLEQAVDYALRI